MAGVHPHPVFGMGTKADLSKSDLARIRKEASGKATVKRKKRG